MAKSENNSTTPWHFETVKQVTAAKLLSQHQELFSGIGTDTRKDLRDQLFIALKGDAFDAHAFLAQAMKAGAAGLLIHDESLVTPQILEQATVFLVKDTLLALQALARHYREKHSAVFLGIAGSNGKTTAKEFTAALIAQHRRVHSAKGSLNNHWGVPFTLLATPEETDVAVIEMGMNHVGELALLANIARVDAAVITTVGIEHIEHFGSLDKIAEAEEEIFVHSSADTCRVYNMDNAYTAEMQSMHTQHFPSAPQLRFSSKDSSAEVFLQVTSAGPEHLTVKGKIAGVAGEATAPVFGKHNVTNLMVAASLGLAAGLTADQVWSALPACRTNWGRNQWVHLRSGAKLLFDGYNSNPDSMAALMSNLGLLSASRKIGIFGQMRELGALSSKYHREVGELVGRSGFDLVWFVGEDQWAFAEGLTASGFRGEKKLSERFDEHVAREIASNVKPIDTIFVKGSRGVELERFVKVCDPLDFTAK